MPDQYIMTAHQLRKGDVVTEQTSGNEYPERNVRISDVEYGALQYLAVRHGAKNPVFTQVIYVTGEDLRTHKVVKWTATGWRRWWVSQREAVQEAVSV